MKKVNIELNVDWDMLSNQKRALIEAINNSGTDALEGILNLIDDIQDQAASQLGNDVVFKEFWDDEEE